MLGLTSLGVIHTAIALVAVIAGAVVQVLRIRSRHKLVPAPAKG